MLWVKYSLGNDRNGSLAEGRLYLMSLLFMELLMAAETPLFKLLPLNSCTIILWNYVPLEKSYLDEGMLGYPSLRLLGVNKVMCFCFSSVAAVRKSL